MPSAQTKLDRNGTIPVTENFRNMPAVQILYVAC